MITGAAMPQLASFSTTSSFCRSAGSTLPQPYLRANTMAGTSSDRPASSPGITPAANSAGTDTCGTSTVKTTNAIDGGIRIAVAPAAAMTLAENAGG